MARALMKEDAVIADLIAKEKKRQRDGMELIPSENIVSPAVREAMGSILTNKYSEGYPHRRYYGGQECIDAIEEVAQMRAKKLFGVPYVNVQPYSGSPANMAVYVATCKPGDTIMGQALGDGGHLTHGHSASASSFFFHAVQYHVGTDGHIDLAEVRRLAREHKPRVLWAGTSAYPWIMPYKELAAIAAEVDAYLVADIAHIAGLIAAGVHPSPVPYADIITTTTHKTLRGPRGAMIMVTEKGLTKDPELPKKIDRAIFPMLQGGPHDHQTAAIAVALKEAATPAFRRYGKMVVANAQYLAKELVRHGVHVVGGGTENHLLLVDCGAGRGVLAEIALDAVGITVNKNAIPNDPSTPFFPSGIRLGTPSITTRGMQKPEMRMIAALIATVMELITDAELPDEKDARATYVAAFRKRVQKDATIAVIREEVRHLCREFPTV